MHDTSEKGARVRPDLAYDEDELNEARRPRVSPGKRAPSQMLGGVVMRAETGAAIGDDATEKLAAARTGGGDPLPEPTRAKFEHSLGADLSRVRVHTDDAAGTAARSMGARAFAHGADVFFASSQYDPSSPAGERLLAHEVAHTVQQGDSAAAPAAKLEVSRRGDALEVEADTAAEAMVAGEETEVSHGAAPIIARDSPDGPSEPEPPPLTEGLDASMLVVSGMNFNIEGTVHANPEAGSATDVRVESNSIGFQSTVGLRDDVRLPEGESVLVGPIQTMTSSNRTAIYRRPDGSVSAEYHAAPDAGNHRDAGGADVPAPFYWAPKTLSRGGQSQSVPFRDQPRFVIPREMSGGRLAETQGSESFITSLSAKRDSTIVHLNSMQWTVPWAMQISDAGRGAGDTIEGRSQTDGAPAADTALAGEAALEWYSFPDIAAARAAGWQTLVRAAPGARARDPESAALIVQALRELNPSFVVRIQCMREFSNFGADDVSLTATGNLCHSATFSLRERGIGTMNFRLLDVFDVNTIDVRAIQFQGTVSGVTDTMPISATWHFPYPTVNDVAMVGSSHTYQISGSVS